MRTFPIDNEKAATLKPLIDQHIDKQSHLMTDGHKSFIQLGQQFMAHSYVKHSLREFSRDNVHCNTAESFSSLFERARIGVFHFISKKHVSRYFDEIGFRWSHRVPEEKKTKTGKTKIQMKPIPIIDMLFILIMRFSGFHLRRTANWGFQEIAFC